MAAVSSRRAVMNLYSNGECPYCHRVRFILAEKGINFEIIEVDLDNKPEDVMELNGYGEVPILVDRDLVLYESNVIMEYLDERFPHPPLMPVDPVSRGKNRLLMTHVVRDWYSLINDLQGSDDKAATKARKLMRDSLAAAAPLFTQSKYFLSDELTLVDCAVAPLLWRLPKWGVKLPANAAPIVEYANRVFNLESFQESLSEDEKEMR